VFLKVNGVMSDPETFSSQQLIQIGKEVLAEPDVDQVLATSMDHLIEISGAERGIIVLFNREGENLFQTARNLDREAIERPGFEVSRTIIETVKIEGKLAYHRNAFREAALQESKSVTRLKILSIICLPLKQKKKIFGVIYLDNRSVQGRFSKETCALVASFADFISAAAFHTLERRQWEQERRALREEIRNHYDFEAIIGSSQQMMDLLKLISQVAETDATVLIEGESGTGKELVARAIHANSLRKEKPLITVNCGAFAENLLESEFFGHEKGAFTGAYKSQKGKFELADGGTLFLDEAHEMSPALQVKLLRVIQWGEYTPVGSEKTKTCDVRIVAASKPELRKLVDAGKFREDLYYRLNLFRIKMPSLRERPEDILLLAEYFLLQACKQLKKEEPEFSSAAKQILQSYHYPGNVRELENVMHRAAILCRSGTIEAEHLPEELRENQLISELSLDNPPQPFKEAKQKVVEEFERRYLQQVLEECNGVISKAAQRAGMHKKNFHEKMAKYGIRKQKSHFQ
jgi:Nif-specific regulatory protein